MTRYLLLNLLFLAVIGMGIALVTRQKITKSLGWTMLVVLGLTAVFDSLIVAAGIVGYNTNRILSVYVVRAPIEDFAYAVASVILVGLLWEYYEKR